MSAIASLWRRFIAWLDHLPQPEPLTEEQRRITIEMGDNCW
jgi:hypothetical protein